MINNFIKRAITGVLFVAILVGCILYDAFSFGILFTAISALTIYEFGQLVNMRAEGVKINKTINMLTYSLQSWDSALMRPIRRYSSRMCFYCFT